MPRTGRGGSRTGMGTPGVLYPNRSDIALPSPPGQAAPGQEYGDAGAQEMRMREMPLSQPPAAGTREPQMPNSATMGQGPQPGPVQTPGSAPPSGPVQMTPAMVPEGGLLNQPTTRPDEPVTAGGRLGPGPGPEALLNGWGTGDARGQAQRSEATGADLLRSLMGRPGAGSTITALAQIAAQNQRG